MQLVLLAFMFLHNHFMVSKEYYALMVSIVAITSLTVLLRTPVLYSSLIWGTGYLVLGVIQTVLVLIATQIGSVSVEDLRNSPFMNNMAMLATFIITLIIVYYMDKKRLGFMFIVNRFRLQKRMLRPKDFFVALFFICSVSLLQFGLVSYFTNELNQYLVGILGSMIVISLIGLYITYVFNIKEIDERFDMLRNKRR